MKQFCLFVFCLFSFTAEATAIRWLDDNIISLPEKKITISRPDKRWRVEEGTGPNLLNFVFLKNGKNFEISLSEKTGFKHLRRQRAHSGKAFGLEANYRRQLLRMYEEQGFKFFEYKTKDNTVEAMGSDKDRNLMLLYFYFSKELYRNDPYVLRVVFPRHDYEWLKDDFSFVTQSLQKTN